MSYYRNCHRRRRQRSIRCTQNSAPDHCAEQTALNGVEQFLESENGGGWSPPVRASPEMLADGRRFWHLPGFHRALPPLNLQPLVIIAADDAGRVPVPGPQSTPAFEKGTGGAPPKATTVHFIDSATGRCTAVREGVSQPSRAVTRAIKAAGISLDRSVTRLTGNSLLCACVAARTRRT